MNEFIKNTFKKYSQRETKNESVCSNQLDYFVGELLSGRSWSLQGNLLNIKKLFQIFLSLLHLSY